MRPSPGEFDERRHGDPGQDEHDAAGDGSGENKTGHAGTRQWVQYRRSSMLTGQKANQVSNAIFQRGGGL
jgi:hypothetical protein